MASGQPVDLQREARWPNQTEVFFGQQKGVKGAYDDPTYAVGYRKCRASLTHVLFDLVEFTERDEESDWDDY